MAFAPCEAHGVEVGAHTRVLRKRGSYAWSNATEKQRRRIILISQINVLIFYFRTQVSRKGTLEPASDRIASLHTTCRILCPEIEIIGEREAVSHLAPSKSTCRID